MSKQLFTAKDNEFIAWYPLPLGEASAGQVWERRRAAWYVHIPFCAAICHYCGFAVSKVREAAVERYLSALHDEIAIIRSRAAISAAARPRCSRARS